jgi:site-specific DNA-methyltransferase (adenine-specific)
MIELFNDDCMKIMAKYPDKYFDLAIVDPPYGIDMAKWDTIENRPTAEYFNELFRVSKKQMIFGGNYFTLPITKGWLCWDKSFSDIINKTKYHSNGMAKFELCWTSFLLNAEMVRFTDIGNVRGFNGKLKVNYNQQKAIHITQKPIEIYAWILQQYAEPNQKILDTHLGSGSSAIAAHYFGVDFVGCEIDKDYFDKMMKRFELETAQTSLQF